MPNTITLSGFKEFENKLHNLPLVLKNEVDFAVQDAAAVWSQRAKQDAPKDQGRLVNAIKPVHIKTMESEVVSPVDYSAYVEWGTKTKVRVPAEMSAYASQFRGARPGSGKAKEMIYAWMARVGIPKEKQWFVFISIITKGINPHPFFFIQRPIIEKQFVEDIKDILSTPH